MTKKTMAFIVARLSSSRLPQKNILPLAGIPMIVQLANRLKMARKLDDIAIVTSTETTDDPMEEVATHYKIKCFRGSLNNVMERICGAIDHFQVDHVVEILGDNPLIHGQLVDDTLELFFSQSYDYVATLTREYQKDRHFLDDKNFALGLRVQAYTAKAAKSYVNYPEYINADKHPCAYIFEHPEIFKIGFLTAENKWKFLNHPEINFAVNYPENFTFMKNVFDQFSGQERPFPLKDLMAHIEHNQQLLNLLGAPKN